VERGREEPRRRPVGSGGRDAGKTRSSGGSSGAGKACGSSVSACPGKTWYIGRETAAISGGRKRGQTERSRLPRPEMRSS
jgi:hypothetical protein